MNSEKEQQSGKSTTDKELQHAESEDFKNSVSKTEDFKTTPVSSCAKTNRVFSDAL